MNEFGFHTCYNTATSNARRVCAADGKSKFGFLVGILVVMACVYVPPLGRWLVASGDKSAKKD